MNVVAATLLRRLQCTSSARVLSTASATPSSHTFAAAAVRATHHRLYDRRDTEFVLHELGDTPREDARAILDACHAFSEKWHHVDPVLDKSPPRLVP
mmetsp:Transcript_17247/g.39444  ORF Transcript_17247/g.39444 Transcript_17247/m.39444 type:complete len:97 (-) Transcript_17247:276-566(-)